MPSLVRIETPDARSAGVLCADLIAVSRTDMRPAAGGRWAVTAQPGEGSRALAAVLSRVEDWLESCGLDAVPVTVGGDAYLMERPRRGVRELPLAS